MMPKTPSGPNLLNSVYDDIDCNISAVDENDLLFVGNMPAKAMGNYKPLFLGYYTAEDVHDKLVHHVSKFERHAGKTIGELLKQKGFTDIIIDIDASLFMRIDAEFSFLTMKSLVTAAPAAYRSELAEAAPQPGHRP
eukprot:m51a1_g13225 hypothetical protein (137) ;mRNA; f:1567-2568